MYIFFFNKMDTTCAMIGCYNSSDSRLVQQFYSFPKNFDLCMLWVQNCGRAELFEDFAYGGAQPFISKVICSDHFNTSDFNDPNSLSKGLKEDAVPNLNSDESDFVVIKQEYEQPDDSLAGDELMDDIHESNKGAYIASATKIHNLLKQESTETETKKFCSSNLSNRFEESVEQFLYDDLEHDKLLTDSYVPLLILSKDKLPFKDKDTDSIEFQNSQKAFKKAWKRALESAEQREARNRANALRNAFRRANETEEQRKARNYRIPYKYLEGKPRHERRFYKNISSCLSTNKKNQANALRNACRRANETNDEKKDRLYKNAIRAALRRSMESENEQKERRRKNALRAAFRRSVETEEQRAERRLKDKVRSAERRKKETDLQSKIRKYNDAVRAAFRRNNESNEQRQQRRMYDVLRAARRRSSENPEQRTKRLQADRERAAKRRMVKKLTQSVANLHNVFLNKDLGSYLDHDNGSTNSSMKSEYVANDSGQDHLSTDELSSHSSYTYSDVSEHNVDSESNIQNNFYRISELNNQTNCDSRADDMNLPNLNLHNPRIEINPTATTEQPVSAVTTPEVVWCT